MFIIISWYGGSYYFNGNSICCQRKASFKDIFPIPFRFGIGVKGVDQILKIVRPGNYIGLQTVLFEKINQFSVTALERCVVCFINNLSFKELISQNTKFANELLLFLCGEELTYFDRFVNVHQKQINGRMAEIILFFSEEINSHAPSFNIPLSRSDMAALICTAHESVTRAIKDLSNIKTIRVSRKKFEILDLKLLKEISEKGNILDEITTETNQYKRSMR